MKAKEFFRQVQRAESELKVLNAKLRHYEDLGLSIGGSAGVTGNKQRGTSRVELAACGAVDALRDLTDRQKEYMAIIASAEKVIAQIPQEKYRKLLEYHYLCGWKLTIVSDELDYRDSNSVYRAHGWALLEAQKVLDKMDDK